MSQQEEVLLEVSGLRVSGPAQQEILKGVSLRIFAREVLALVGESGSGKSTLALALRRLLPSYLRLEGKLLWGKEAVDLAEGKNMGFEKEIAYIFQEPSSFLNPTLNIASQLSEIFIYRRRLPRRKALELSQKLLHLVRINDPEKKLYSFPHQLSGGEAQRVMIAMALAQEPRLLIADEPTSNLDVTIEMEILSLVKAMQKRFGFSVLFITHDLSLVKYFAARSLFLRAGKIVAEAGAGEPWGNIKNAYVQKLVEASGIEI